MSATPLAFQPPETNTTELEPSLFPGARVDGSRRSALKRALRDRTIVPGLRKWGVETCGQEIDSVQRAAGEISLLYDVAHEIATSSDLESTLVSVLDRAKRAVHGEYGSISLGNVGQNDRQALSALTTTHSDPAMSPALSKALTNWMDRHRQPLLLNSGHDWRASGLDNAAMNGIGSLISVPLQANSRLVGVLTISRRFTRRPFGKEDGRVDDSGVGCRADYRARDSPLGRASMEKAQQGA